MHEVPTNFCTRIVNCWKDIWSVWTEWMFSVYKNCWNILFQLTKRNAGNSVKELLELQMYGFGSEIQVILHQECGLVFFFFWFMCSDTQHRPLLVWLSLMSISHSLSVFCCWSTKTSARRWTPPHHLFFSQLPDGVNVSKEARRAISQAASVFVLYATSW